MIASRAVAGLLFVLLPHASPSAQSAPATWRLVAERVIAPEEGSPGELGAVRGLAVDRAGMLYVLQTSPATIKVFAPDGRWLRDIGREGEGPGEFRGGALALVRDTLVVHEGARLIRFTLAGAPAGIGRGRCCWTTATLPAFADGTIGLLGQAGARAYGIFFTRLDGAVTDSALFPMPPVRAPGHWVADRTIGGQTETMRVRIPLFPATHSAWLPDHRLATGTTGTAAVAITSPRHDTLRLLRLAGAPVSLPERTRETLFRDAVASEGEAWEPFVRRVARPDDIPPRWPAWSGLATDPLGRVWIGRPGPGGEAARLDVFGADGRPLASLASPHPRLLQGTFTGERVYLADEDADGRPVVRVYRLQR